MPKTDKNTKPLTKAELAKELSRAKAREAAVKGRLKAARHKAMVAEKTQLSGFMDFVRSQGVVGLAIGIVIGTQVKALTDQLIASFINPLLGLVLPGGGSLAEKHFTLTVYGRSPAVFNYGAFVAVLLSFLTVAAVIYYIVKGLGLDKLDKKKE